ncbi:MAG: triose-phosphate isomerase [Kiritimatiellae bacterium]|nr:triose-phosphate isomerase [Kiritimatiellia bacterium]
MRRKIVAGNWKMNKTPSEARALASEIAAALGAEPCAVEVVVCPPAIDLPAVASALAGTQVGYGAQNMHHEPKGAFTGETAAPMLLDLGAKYVILGHSERRTYFGEKDADVNAKTKAALAAGLTPIVCVGETLEQRDAGKTGDVVAGQVRDSLAGIGADLVKVVIAYEPVWAIGTGRTATPAQAQEVHALIRKTLAEMAGAQVADDVRIQYGGSMKPENAAELMAQPDIDGGLIGGASLKADSFLAIVKAGL